MMSMTQNTLKRMLALSKLTATEAELKHFTDDLNKVVSLLDSVHSVDAEAFAPMVSPLRQVKVLREDRAVTQNHGKEFKDFSPEFEAGHFIVPKVID